LLALAVLTICFWVTATAKRGSYEMEEVDNPLLMDQNRFEKEVLGGASIDDAHKPRKDREGKYPVWLLYFSAPWCANCRRIQPVWDQVANYLADG